LESTYGSRRHEPPLSTREALAAVIHSTIAKGGNVVIPAFAVGRTQEVLYELKYLVGAGQLPRDLMVVLDSPLAIAATEITASHADLFDEAAAKLAAHGEDPFHFPGLILSHTAEESMALNQNKEPKVIISASGMCEAGRVVHHLKHNLWRPVCTVLFVGFQAEGTLGRRLIEGAGRVRIHGDDVAVRARIQSLQGLSAHADQGQLLDWVSQLKRPPSRTLLVHGEATERRVLAQLLTARGHRVDLPVIGEEVLLEHLPARVAARKAPARELKGPSRVAVANGATLARTSRRMAAVLREFAAVRKAWHANGPHMPEGQFGELQQRAEDLLRSLEEMRRLIDSAGT
jgi:metallo-beta-lactamase family protein